ncbi:MAG: hypothetical protein Q9228_002329 [Teloschistes exilis]
MLSIVATQVATGRNLAPDDCVQLRHLWRSTFREGGKTLEGATKISRPWSCGGDVKIQRLLYSRGTHEDLESGDHHIRMKFECGPTTQTSAKNKIPEQYKISLEHPKFYRIANHLWRFRVRIAKSRLLVRIRFAFEFDSNVMIQIATVLELLEF